MSGVLSPPGLSVLPPEMSDRNKNRENGLSGGGGAPPDAQLHLLEKLVDQLAQLNSRPGGQLQEVVAPVKEQQPSPVSAASTAVPPVHDDDSPRKGFRRIGEQPDERHNTGAAADNLDEDDPLDYGDAWPMVETTIEVRELNNFNLCEGSFEADIEVTLDWADRHLREGIHFFENQRTAEWVFTDFVLGDVENFFNPVVFFENFDAEEGLVEAEELPTIVDHVPTLLAENCYGEAPAADGGASKNFQKTRGNARTNATRSEEQATKAAGFFGAAAGGPSFAGAPSLNNCSGGTFLFDSTTMDRRGDQSSTPKTPESGLTFTRQLLWLTKRFRFRGEFRCLKLDASNFPLDIQRLTLHLKARPLFGKRVHLADPVLRRVLRYCERMKTDLEKLTVKNLEALPELVGSHVAVVVAILAPGCATTHRRRS